MFKLDFGVGADQSKKKDAFMHYVLITRAQFFRRRKANFLRVFSFNPDSMSNRRLFGGKGGGEAMRLRCRATRRAGPPGNCFASDHHILQDKSESESVVATCAFHFPLRMTTLGLPLGARRLFRRTPPSFAP